MSSQTAHFTSTIDNNLGVAAFVAKIVSRHLFNYKSVSYSETLLETILKHSET